MAKAVWCTVTPTTGSGNGSVVISAAAHTGRTARSTAVTIQNQSGTKPSKAITVNQAEKVETLTLNVANFPAMTAAECIIKVSGKSNSKYIGIADGSYYVYDKTNLKINGAAQVKKKEDNGTESIIFTINNDIGATAEYDFEFELCVPANNKAYARSTELMAMSNSVSPDSNSMIHSVYLEGNQPGITSALSSDKSSISLINAGTAQNVAITSNDSWIVS